MGKPAARLTDMHTCPMVTPGLPPIPHVGGPISGPCVPTVLIGMMPAATVTDMCICVGPPDTIAMGSPTVFIGGKMAARMGDPTMHGGVIVMGCPTVLIGESGSGGAGGGGGGALPSPKSFWDTIAELISAAVQKADDLINDLLDRPTDAQWEQIDNAMTALKDQMEAKRKGIIDKDPETLSSMEKWFGNNDEKTQEALVDRIDKQLTLLDSMDRDNFRVEEKANTYAYVYPNDKEHKITLCDSFWEAEPTGPDSQMGTIAHEMSHFNDYGATDDHVYGRGDAEQLADASPDDAMNNADNFEYFIEGD